MSLRVPTADVSVVDLTLPLAKPASYEQIKAAMKARFRRRTQGHFSLHRDDVVSKRFYRGRKDIGFRREGGIALSDTFVKLVAWYDNEWDIQTSARPYCPHGYQVIFL